MTNPPDPGHPQPPAEPGQAPGSPAPGAYGTPPPRHPGRVPEPRPPAQQPGQPPRQQTGPLPQQQPGPPPQQWQPSAQSAPHGGHPGHQQPGQGPGQEWGTSQRPGKGVLAALFDTNFNSLITPKLVKLWYVLAMVLVTLQCLVILVFGLRLATWDELWGWGVVAVVASPLIWLFELLLVRIFMEAVVVRFKQAEHLQAIKDRI